MLYVYRRRNSTGARDLVEGILMAGTQARRTRGLALRTLQAGDAVVCWGDHFAAPAGTRALNNVAPLSKLAEAQRLAAKGVLTVQVSRAQPAVAAAARAAFVENFFDLPMIGRPAAGRVNGEGAHELASRLVRFADQERQRRVAWEAQPVVPAETWLPRRNNHIGGNDLLEENLRDADFYSKKENIVEEYRLHMFGGKSIRAGRKVARPTRPDNRTPAHAWIRSFDAGWVIHYDGFESTKPMRDLAANALKALDLNFGAVDMGKRADGSLIVLEVNRAPGIEGGTVNAYAKHIIAWLANREA